MREGSLVGEQHENADKDKTADRQQPLTVIKTASWSARVYAEKKASYLISRWKETHGESRTSADKAAFYVFS